jgi:hypothetical protein
MQDWKTTVTGLVTAIAGLLAHFSIIIPESLQSIIVLVGVFLIGLFAKDGASKPAGS